MVTIYNTPLSTTSEKALFGRPGGANMEEAKRYTKAVAVQVVR